MNFIHNNHGFTLTELLVSMVIGVLLFGLVVSVFILNQNVARQTSIQGELLQNGRLLSDQLTRELRQAKELVTVLPASEIEFEDGHTTTQIQYVRYYLDGTDVYRQIKVYYFPNDPGDYVHFNDTDAFGGPEEAILENRLVGEYLTSLLFTMNGSMNITMTLEQRDVIISLTSNVAPRNI